MNCPKCGSDDIRVSHHAHKMDVIHHMRGEEAYRCRACRHRFYDSKSAAVGMKKSHRPVRFLRVPQSRKRFERRERLPYQIMTVTLLAIALSIFWFLLRFIDMLH
jgi:transposase-like protein